MEEGSGSPGGYRIVAEDFRPETRESGEEWYRVREIPDSQEKAREVFDEQRAIHLEARKREAASVLAPLPLFPPGARWCVSVGSRPAPFRGRVTKDASDLPRRQSPTPIGRGGRLVGVYSPASEAPGVLE
jgi:hypothetical protein